MWTRDHASTDTNQLGRPAVSRLGGDLCQHPVQGAVADADATRHITRHDPEWSIATCIEYPESICSSCHASCRSRWRTFPMIREVRAVTVSMRVMSAGDGYKYLLRTVAAGDGERPLSTPLTRYYSAEGTPPGRWIGSGLRGLGRGSLVEDGIVSESQLQLLIGMGRDPVTGSALGRAYPVYVSAAVGETSSPPRKRRAVAGYDFTFSIPKSASVLWGIADAATQERIATAHHAAVAQVVAFIEREVAATRTGSTARKGAVAQVDLTGVVATAFDHFDSRAGDPHLHTHVVISNKVQTVLDDKWRSLDGRPMHAAVVALSKLHEALFADELTRMLGIEWEARDRGPDRNVAWAITTVPEALVREFSSRVRHIDVQTDQLIAEFVAAHGHRPDAATIMKLRAQATLMTRPAKEVRSLQYLTAEWRDRASRIVQADATQWARAAMAPREGVSLRAEDVSLDAISRLGLDVIAAVGEKRATWTRWNLSAEATRQTMGMRFQSASDREAIVGMIVDSAEQSSLRLTPPELASTPVEFQRQDGSSVFRPKHSAVFTSETLMEAEARLLTLGRDLSAPTVTPEFLRIALRHRRPGGSAVSSDQTSALRSITTSRRVVDVLVGPAGSGKTTAMRALRRAWELQHGSGSVVGLAPSAAAAQMLAEELDIRTENTAKWWQMHLADGERFRRGQLVIIDEASLAGTRSLDRICALAAESGAKVLLVGDYAQLQSVDAGGAFTLLARDRDDVPTLVDLHRFAHRWERDASLLLREGDADAVDAYLEHDRLREGQRDEMADAAYVAWRQDILRGRSTILVSDSREAVGSLNLRARADLILEDVVDASNEIELHDGTRASRGDVVITRHNDRTLRAGRSWVRNGDRWTITALQDDGSVVARRVGARGGAGVILPASYATAHVELGYAVTAHRAQGTTTDTAHVLVDAGMTRENLYVAMTRGRQENIAYVAVDRPDGAHDGPHPADDRDATARSMLYGVLQHTGAEKSAHGTMAAEQDAWGSIAQLAAEYETIAAAAQRNRWVGLIRACGLSAEQVERVEESDAFGPLTAELRRAEANHYDVDALLLRVVRSRPLDDAEDVAAMLRYRVARATARPTGSGRARRTPLLIAGLVPQAVGAMSPEMRQALTERERLMEIRADGLIEAALSRRERWVTSLGQVPHDDATAAVWKRAARVVATYRDRYGVTDQTALGGPAATDTQSRDLEHARAYFEHARGLARTNYPRGVSSQSVARSI